MDLGANNNQRGTAAAMLGKMFKGQNKPKRIVAAVPTGKGKSRIIAALVSGMCLTGCARKIVVVFPSEILMKTDQEVLTKIAKLSQVKDAELECRVGLKDLKYDKHTFYIVDECDYELFEQQQMEAARHAQVKGWIGLTASSWATGMEHLELLEKGFHTVDPKISNTVNEHGVEECELVEFFQKHPGRAKLIFAKEEAADVYKELAKEHDLTYIENCQDLEIIRNLTGKDMLVVTEEILMRGVDYRAQHGIDLLIATTTSTKRSFLQCLGRVGRGTDEAGRYILKNTAKFRPEFQDKQIN